MMGAIRETVDACREVAVLLLLWMAEKAAPTQRTKLAVIRGTIAYTEATITDLTEGAMKGDSQ